MTRDVTGNDICYCYVATIGEKATHYPWRVCSNCKTNIDDIPDKCPSCGFTIAGFVDEYIRRKKIILD